MNELSAKKWLQRGIRLREEKEQLEELREETFTRLTNTTQNMDAVGGGTKDPHKFDNLAALDVEISRKIEELDRTRFEIYTAINKLPDRRQRLVLTGHYLQGKTWEEIAVAINYDIRHIYRIHGAALQAIYPHIGKKKEMVD